MEQQSHSAEHNSIDTEDVRSRTSSVHENFLSEESFNRQQSIRSGPAVLEDCERLLEIHPTRQSLEGIKNNHDNLSVITINVSRNRFQTYLSTLQSYPETLLGNENKRKHYWNSNTQEYFFDRHRACFESILYYYQSYGRLRRPELVPLDTFLEEVSFFQLGSEAFAQIHRTENIKVAKHTPLPRILWRRYIWFYLEFPQYSVLARFIQLISMFFTILFCLSLAIESLPIYKHHWKNICKQQANVSSDSSYIPRCSAMFTSPFFIIQTICVTYFTIEFLLRLISTPSYFRFVLSFLNWIDLGTIVSYLGFLAIELSEQNIRLLGVLRFLQIFKIYLAFRKLKALRVIISTIKESLMDFAVMITILTLIAFLFGAAVYFAEQEVNGDVFDSIPKATYWGIMTITRVGYGDMYPVTATGRILSCFCAFVGAGMMGMLVSVLVDRYQRISNRKMYVSESEISTVEFDQPIDSQDDTNIGFSSRKSSRRRQLSSSISHRLSSVNKRSKNDQRRLSSGSYKVQFVVSFDGENIDNHEADTIVTTMKEKMTEAVTNTGPGINLKSIQNKSNKLWTRSTSSSPSNLPTTTSNIDNIKLSKSQTF